MARHGGELIIDLGSLTAAELADARAYAAAGGVDLASVDLGNLATLPVPALSALIYVTLRRESPRITVGRCVRLACTALGVPDGG